MTLTVKHVAASRAQAQNLLLFVQIAASMGANPSQMAGGMATMIQESAAVNMQGGDRDSAGLFQQRPSVGSWGTYAQVTDPVHAIKAFLTPYLNYCRQGHDWLTASDLTQHSAYREAPAQWYSESVSNVNQLTNGKGYRDATASISSLTGSTRAAPYQFSRGSSGQKETSWDCMGRLATEVNWRRFMRAGTLWFVSDQWLKQQPPRFAMAVGARGVLSISFDADSRRNASEATVQALAKRWAVLPGDVVTVSGEGPGDGLWLVYDTRRSLWSQTTEIQLKRPAPKLAEPAPTTTSSYKTTVAGITATPLNGPNSLNVPDQAAQLYNACATMSSWNIPYSISQRQLVARPPSADCSSSCSWALLYSGFPLPGGVGKGAWAPVSGAFMSGWGQPGEGKYFTVWCSPEHIWIRFHGFPMWRFDTSPHGDGPSGPHLRKSARDTATFTARHWQGL